MATTQAISPATTQKAPTPSTPASKAASAQATPSPGNWRHPRYAEITERQRASVFDGTNLNKIAINSVVLLLSFNRQTILNLLPPILTTYLLHPLTTFLPSWLPALWLTRALLLANVLYALGPFFRKPDNLSNIDLNASQRKLLGLDPRATPPPTAATKYVTPPRYARSPATNRSASTGTPATPLSGSPSMTPPPAGFLRQTVAPQQKVDDMLAEAAAAGTLDRGRNASPFKNSWAGSPGGGGGTPTRYGPGTPPGAGSVFAPSTPSPVGRQASVPLNSRWLYERGRRSSSGSFGL